VIFVLPFLIGHFISTFLTCSQRSALVLTSLIRPYLTCNIMYAPSSMFSWNVPRASIVSVLPLYSVSFETETVRSSTKETHAEGGLGDRLTCRIIKMSSSCVSWQNSSGDSPGTATLPSRIRCSPPKKDKPSDATIVLRSNVRRLVDNFMLICVTFR